MLAAGETYRELGGGSFTTRYPEPDQAGGRAG
jgi:hypothetical protein